MAREGFRFTEPEDPDNHLIKMIFSAKTSKKLAAANVSTNGAGAWYRTDLRIVTTAISVSENSLEERWVSLSDQSHLS